MIFSRNSGMFHSEHLEISGQVEEARQRKEEARRPWARERNVFFFSFRMDQLSKNDGLMEEILHQLIW